MWLLYSDGRPAPGGYTRQGTVGSTAASAVGDFLAPLTDFLCARCRYENNHYLTADGVPPGANWTNNGGGVAWVFKAQYPEMVPLYRMGNPGEQAWAYAILLSPAWNDYLARGYSQHTLLGYVWP